MNLQVKFIILVFLYSKSWINVDDNLQLALDYRELSSSTQFVTIRINLYIWMKSSILGVVKSKQMTV